MRSPDVIASGLALFAPDKGTCTVPAQLPLPGVIIFVHGVNSDGEWYEATEEGLCKGLNTRLAREDAQLTHKGVKGGTLTPATYLRELTDDGFINPEYRASSFIANDPNHSPIIRFRWGYKATLVDLKAYGHGIFLNEHNYWGGGPFANGCTSLADLWGDGLDPHLFLSITAQHLNPTDGRDVYACPARHYYAHAAHRLAELVGLVRKMQPDVPITVVGHSQGTMITLASAFYGEGCNGVADNYVIANAPYNLDDKGMFADNIAQLNLTNANGEAGRQTGHARLTTLQNLAALVRARQGSEQPAKVVDARCANLSPADGSAGYAAATDPHVRRGTVTVYCNPHDQVISATTVRGIGWCGIGPTDMTAINSGGAPVFVQRVFAQGWPMGKTGQYHYWHDRTPHPESAAGEYWHPPSPVARYQFRKGLEATDNWIAKFITVVGGAAIFAVLIKAMGARINAEPKKDWAIPLNARPLPATSADYTPQSRRLGRNNAHFDEGKDAPADHLNRNRVRTPDDPFAEFLEKHDSQPSPHAQPDPSAAADAEAQLRYEYRAQLRMRAMRDGRDRDEANKTDDQTSAGWKTWSREQVTKLLKKTLDQNATDHSTIMTHPDNAQQVLAYDVAVGIARLDSAQWNELRIAADWRLLPELEAREHKFGEFAQYIKKGTLNDRPLSAPENYAQSQKMPKRIVDQRSWKMATEHDNPQWYGA